MAEPLAYVARQMLARGVSAFERDDYGAALTDFRAVLEQHPDFADVHNKAGLCLALLGSAEAALEEFDHAVRLNPSYVEAHLNRAIVLNDLGYFPQAREAVETAGRLEKRGGDARFRGDVGNRIAGAHADLADLYSAAGDHERAVDQYHEALRLRPHFVDVRTRLARSLLAMDRSESARAELESILEANPSYTDARIVLGATLLRLDDRDGAVREWTRAAREAPDDLRPKAYLATLDSPEPSALA